MGSIAEVHKIWSGKRHSRKSDSGCSFKNEWRKAGGTLPGTAYRGGFRKVSA